MISFPDHGHLMHLFLLKWPGRDRIYHLHPTQAATGYFESELPTLPKGVWRICGDIVHDNGLAETAVGNVKLTCRILTASPFRETMQAA
jgi:hypothetical protein